MPAVTFDAALEKEDGSFSEADLVSTFFAAGLDPARFYLLSGLFLGLLEP